MPHILAQLRLENGDGHWCGPQVVDDAQRGQASTLNVEFARQPDPKPPGEE